MANKQKPSKYWWFVPLCIGGLIYGAIQTLAPHAHTIAIVAICLAGGIVMALVLRAIFKAVSKKEKQNVAESMEITLSLYDVLMKTSDLHTFFDSYQKLYTETVNREKYLKKAPKYGFKTAFDTERLLNNKQMLISECLRRSYLEGIEFMKNGNPYVEGAYEETSARFSSEFEADTAASAERYLTQLKEYRKVVGTLAEADSLDGHEFEQWCADLLKKQGFADVEVTKGSGDQGVDVIAVKDGVRYAIQCKCYSSDLGNSPVQEVTAGKQFYNCQIGAVMTNRHFTTGAVELAKANGILLWDRDTLEEMLQKTKLPTASVSIR